MPVLVFTSHNQLTDRLQIAFSAGIAQYPDDGTDLPTLYQSAAAALHQSKIAGCAYISAAGDT